MIVTCHNSVDSWGNSFSKDEWDAFDFSTSQFFSHPWPYLRVAPSVAGKNFYANVLPRCEGAWAEEGKP
jgi:hypothetical protein